MSHLVTSPAMRRHAGFTLVELAIAVVVIAILAAIAIPSFVDSVRKSRRSDAFVALSSVQQAQERWRSNNAAYAPLANTAEAGNPPNGLGLSSQSPSAYYAISLSDVDNTTYTAVAAAASDKSQAADTGCQAMAVRLTGGNLRYAGASSVAELNFDASDPDPNRCWAR